MRIAVMLLLVLIVLTPVVPIAISVAETASVIIAVKILVVNSLDQTVVHSVMVSEDVR
jgi:hypothetical protein